MKSYLGLTGGLIAAGLLAACGQAAETQEPEVDLQARADTLAQETLIVDTHIDVPYRLMEEMEDISTRTAKGDFDYPRAVAGGLNAPFMSIYVPASYQETGGAKEYADKLVDMVEGFERDWPDKFVVARSVADVEDAFRRGAIALPMGMENGAPIEGSLNNLKHFYDRGIRYITLTHSENNHISDSSYADEPEWNGLSPFGREVVAGMNRLGIIIDISHVSDKAFYQVMELTKAPAIASHSSCRRFTPEWERNMDDAMIKRLGENGGVIQINFGSAFINESAHKQSKIYFDLAKADREAKGYGRDSDEAKAFREAYWKENKRIYADLSDVIDHVDNVVSIAGVDHVGLGSDFDGVGDSLPIGLKDVSNYPNLIRALLERGYSDEDIRKICSGNILRVWSEVERVARQSAEGT